MTSKSYCPSGLSGQRAVYKLSRHSLPVVADSIPVKVRDSHLFAVSGGAQRGFYFYYQFLTRSRIPPQHRRIDNRGSIYAYSKTIPDKQPQERLGPGSRTTRQSSYVFRSSRPMYLRLSVASDRLLNACVITFKKPRHNKTLSLPSATESNG